MEIPLNLETTDLLKGMAIGIIGGFFAIKAKFIDHDILKTVEDFLTTAQDDCITVDALDLYGNVVKKDIQFVR